jgi:hypothetical protein
MRENTRHAKINCEITHGKIAKGEKAAELGLERLRE